jgi:hypothetical protein
MDEASTVTATFATGRPGGAASGGGPTPDAYRLSVSVNGRGRVVSSPRGIACAGRCSAWFPKDSNVSLRALPARGWRFTAWSGRCSARTAGCSLSMSGDRAVRALFTRR